MIPNWYEISFIKFCWLLQSQIYAVLNEFKSGILHIYSFFLKFGICKVNLLTKASQFSPILWQLL